jgi:polysaccharide pyruvyl transferase WcaK-like protein
MMLRKIAVVDTSFGTWNLGDEIIMEAVNDVVSEMFPDARVFRLPCHEALSRRSYYFLRNSDLCFLGGTNILGSKGWRLHWYDLLFLNKAICLGVTWGGAGASPSFRDRLLLRHVLDSKHVHSVRDEYTKQLLDELDIASVSTSCPTMWRLTAEHCLQIPRSKSDKVVFTLTGYRRDPNRDKEMIEVLERNYQEIYFFPQMHGDYEYFETLRVENVKIIPPNLRAYDQFLSSAEVDYVGSRLHGGIRALQSRKRTLIVAVDHRSTEIGRDTNLPVLLRDEIENLEERLHQIKATSIDLPLAEIERWKASVRIQ